MGCCLYKLNAGQSSVGANIIEAPSYRIALQTLKGNLDLCLYGCGGLQSFIFLNPKTILSIRIFELLFERGFVRNAEYFRKYDSNKCCCIGYNSRVLVKDNTPTKKQNQIILNFLQVIEQIQNGTFQERAKQKIIDQPIQKQVQNQPLVYTEEIQQILNEISNLIQSSHLEVDLKILEPTYVKVFLNEDNFFTNHNLLLYHKNQTQLKRMNIQQQQFNILLGQQLNGKCILQNKYFLELKKSGYLNIIRKDHQKKIKKEKKTKVQVKIKEINKFSDDLIDLKTFTFEEFHVGKMKINIKNPQTTEEIVQLYLDYMAGVHFDISDRESFIRNYTPCVLEQNEFLVDQKSKKRLQLGQRFMEYRINGNLIGVGVIVLTTKHLISEYLFYQPYLKKKSFGIFAAFVEIDYVKQIQKIFPQFQYQSLSYIISTNKSMSYKMQFNSLEIQCCNSYEWLKFNKEIKEKMKGNQSQLCDKQVQQQFVNANYCMFFYKGNNLKFNQLDKKKQEEVNNKISSNNVSLCPQLMTELVFEIEE